MSFIIGIVSAEVQFADQIEGSLQSALPASWLGGEGSSETVSLAEEPHTQNSLNEIIRNGRSLLERYPDAGPLRIARGATDSLLLEQIEALRETDPDAVWGQLFIDFSETELGDGGVDGVSERFQHLINEAKECDIEILSTPYFSHAFLPAIPCNGIFHSRLRNCFSVKTRINSARE